MGVISYMKSIGHIDRNFPMLFAALKKRRVIVHPTKLTNLGTKHILISRAKKSIGPYTGPAQPPFSPSLGKCPSTRIFLR